MSSTMSDNQTSIHVQGIVQHAQMQKRAAPIYAFFWLLGEALSILPTHEDNEEAEASAKTVKTVVLVIGLLIVLAGYRHTFVILPGVLVMLLALVVPISKSQKKHLLKQFQRKRFTSVIEEQPAELIHDGRRLILEVNSERICRVLTNRNFEMEVFAPTKTSSTPQPSCWVCVRPGSSRKKRDRICIGLLNEKKLSSLSNFEPSKSENMIVVDANTGEAQQLLARLQEVQDAL